VEFSPFPEKSFHIYTQKSEVIEPCGAFFQFLFDDLSTFDSILGLMVPKIDVVTEDTHDLNLACNVGHPYNA